MSTETLPQEPQTQLEVHEPKVSVNTIALSSNSHGTTLTVGNIGEVMRFADLMSRTAIGVPAHLRGNPGACTAVVLQAMQWGFSPLSVAMKTYLVKDLIAYEAQLIAAVINTRAGLKRRPKITFEGAAKARKCKVVGEFLDGSIAEYESPELGMITPQNSPLWKSDPDQQLGYYSIRAFARRHCPEVIMGVYDREEAHQITALPVSDVTDITQQLRDRAAKAAVTAEPVPVQAQPQEPQEPQSKESAE